MEKLRDAEQVLTIQQMAHITGLSAHTLRYYEKVGLMRQHVGRDDANGYRSYTWQHVNWIQFIKRLRTTGMPIRDIQRYTELLRQGDETIPERIQLLKDHQRRVQAHLKEIEDQLGGITYKIGYYEQQYADQQAGLCGEDVLADNDQRTSVLEKV